MRECSDILFALNEGDHLQSRFVFYVVTQVFGVCRPCCFGPFGPFCPSLRRLRSRMSSKLICTACIVLYFILYCVVFHIIYRAWTRLRSRMSSKLICTVCIVLCSILDTVPGTSLIPGTLQLLRERVLPSAKANARVLCGDDFSGLPFLFLGSVLFFPFFPPFPFALFSPFFSFVFSPLPGRDETTVFGLFCWW